MPANRKPKVWNLKPQMTAAPELWRHAIAVFPYWEGAGGATEIITNQRTNPMNSVSEFEWSQGALGRSILMPTQGTTRPTRTAAIPFQSSKIYTTLVVFRSEDTSGVGNDFDSDFFLHDDGNDGQALSINSSGELFLFTFGGNTNGVSTPAVDDNQFHAAVVVFDQINGEVDMIIDGVRPSSFPTSYSDTSSASNANLGLQGAGGRVNEVEVPFLAELESDTRMPDGPLKSWCDDPFAMLRPAGF